MDAGIEALSPQLVAALAAAIGDAEGGGCRIRRAVPVGGGCISRNFRLESDRGVHFLKLGRGAAPMFDAEADGLAALAHCAALVVPRVVCRGAAGGEAFLVLEWLDLDEVGDEGLLGEAVAALHDLRFPRFGWERDNFIGRTPQANAWGDDWARFFAERRLAPQFALARINGAPQLAERGQQLLAELPGLFAGHSPAPVLLHGDLWAGNKAFVGGRPALFDPAVYAGDGETDLAMSALFGGFAPRFFAAYRAVRPPVPGHETRRLLYQLYHVLNHFNLFGGAYARQAEALLGKLLGQLR